LPIPNHATLTRNLLGHLHGLLAGHPVAIADWPPAEASPALSLAQHYGLSTCLLDFTWDPYVAAYFAVRGHMDSDITPTGGLCVWIIDDPNLAMKQTDPLHSLELLVPPASGNRALQAQEGLFIWQRPTATLGVDIREAYREFSPFEEILSQPGLQCRVTKLVLDTKYPFLLLHKLIKLGYDGSRLFPGFEGSATASREYGWARIGPLL
jgi:FRG domain